MNNLFQLNCPNCAAPLNNGKCDYCGTETVGEIRFDECIAFNLVGRDDAGNKYEIPVSGRVSDLTLSTDPMSAFDYSGRILKTFFRGYNVTFTFEGAIRERN